MLDIPSLKECRHALHESRHHRILSGDNPSEIVRDWSLDKQSHVPGLFDLIAEFDDRQESLTGNAAPIQADAAERMGLDNGHTGAKLGGPDCGDIATWSCAENGDVLLGSH